MSLLTEAKMLDGEKRTRVTGWKSISQVELFELIMAYSQHEIAGKDVVAVLGKRGVKAPPTSIGITLGIQMMRLIREGMVGVTWKG